MNSISDIHPWPQAMVIITGVLGGVLGIAVGLLVVYVSVNRAGGAKFPWEK